MTAVLLVLLAFAVPAMADDLPRPVSQVPLLPLAEGPHDDVDALVQAFWQPYYNTGAEHAFGRANLRVGRIDLNGDGQAELVLMVDAPGWEAGQGNPFVVATWIKKRWVAVGWGWGDEDTLFATDEVIGGWRTIDSGSQILRWAGTEYQFTDKN